MARLFSAGDKVFAKVRGYPAWPARVEAVADATPNKTKYHVFFYGTLETAVCKAEDLYSYAENKDNYGRPSKRKFFNEGIAQIEGLIPVPEPVRGTASKAGENDSDTEGNLVIDENPSVRYGKPAKRKRDSDSTGEDTEDKSLLLSIGSAKRRRSSGSITKRTKRESLSSGSVNSESPASSKPEIVSRSGRKIKPKRFADEVNQSNSTDVGLSDSKTADPEAIVQQLDLPINEGSVLDSEIKFAEELSLKNEAQAKENMNTKNTLLGKRNYESHKYKMLMKQIKERRKEKLAWLKIELRLMELEKLIRNRLALDQAEPEKCLELFDELHHLSLEPLMLKKHPEVVETINKIKKYTGNIKGQRISQKQKIKYNAVCEMIRNKAKLLIDKFAKLLDIPDGGDFKDSFSKFVMELKEKTKNLTKVKFYSLTVDPTLSKEKWPIKEHYSVHRESDLENLHSTSNSEDEVEDEIKEGGDSNEM